ncbi:MAG TPA: nuclear transport factor 2 family protein, partial [Gemmatimonadaceae bacterium]|nr:nuclear transport factor 2 family protein [Gemmatimonadaceae bacterium]
MIKVWIKAGAIAIIMLVSAATGRAAAQGQSPSMAPVAETARRFHDLLAAGDSAAVVRLLAPDLVVVESGAVETRAEYLAHHLGADIAFAKAVPAQRQVLSVTMDGDVAWIASSSTASGRMGERQIESRGA